MLLPDFDLLIPKSLDEAVQLLNEYGPDGAELLAGGTDLIVRMKEGTSRPSLGKKEKGIDSAEGGEVLTTL